jgi:hypothetical protein
MLKGTYTPELFSIYYDKEQIFMVMENAGVQNLKEHLRKTQNLVEVGK